LVKIVLTISLCHLAYEGGKLVRPLAQVLQLAFHRGELLQHVCGVRDLVLEVVGDAVQGVGNLVSLVVPLVELAVEAVSVGEDERHVTTLRHIIRQQLQKKSHESRGSNAQHVR
jgi:hypothetical protein